MEERKTTVLLKDGTQIEGSGSIQNLIVMCDTQEAAEELWGKWTEENLEGAKVDGLEIQGLIKSNDYKFIDQRGDEYQLILQARQLTASEREIKRVGNVVDAMAGGGDTETEQILAAQQTRRFMQLQVDAAALPDEQAMEVADLYEEWQPNKAYKQGKILKHGKNADGETQLYRVNQDHTSSSEWIPGTEEALYKAIGFTESGVPIWTQPLGAHDAYDLGDEVSHKGKIWISDYDANTWEPGVFGWHEKE